MIEYKGKDVIIMTCSDCNTKCKHCYIGYKGNFLADDLYNLCLNLVNKYNIYLNGTEILLHEEYFKTIELIGQNYLLTNGLILYKNDSLMKRLKQIGIEHIDMSYHFGIHEEISNINYQIICDNIQRLLDYGIRTELRTTINSYNYKLIPKIIEQAYFMAAEGIKFTNFMKIGEANNMNLDNILTDEQIKIFFKLLQLERKKYNMKDFRIRRCGSFGEDVNNNVNKFRCIAGSDSVAITPNLNVYPCFFLTSPGNEIGYVRNGKIFVQDEFNNEKGKCLAKTLYNRR